MAFGYGGEVNKMKYNTARRLINKIMKYNCVDIGVFISLLVDIYIHSYDITEKEFITSLKNSLRALKEERNEERNNIC